MKDSRLVRELLAANLKLTEQVCEMARLAIGAPSMSPLQGAPMPAETVPPFTFSTADDWDDVPAEVDAEVAGALLESATKDARMLQLVQPRTEEADLPPYMTEEEEDLRYQVAMEQRPPADLTQLLNSLRAPSSEMTATLV